MVQIGGKQKEGDELQRQWIKAQTELVGLVADINQQQDRVKECTARVTLLKQKRVV